LFARADDVEDFAQGIEVRSLLFPAVRVAAACRTPCLPRWNPG
jgi:hypothetical protein